MKSVRTHRPKHGSKSKSLVEDIDNACITSQHAIKMLVSRDDLYNHHRAKRVFAQAGFTLWLLGRNEAHPVWVGWLRPGKLGILPDKTQATRPGGSQPKRLDSEG